MAVYAFRFRTNHGIIVAKSEAPTEQDALGKAWAKVVKAYPDIVYYSYTCQ